MPAQQPTLDGTLPEPAHDYASWRDLVWPAFVEVARSGRQFTTFEVAREYQLPEPRNGRSDWGNLAQALAKRGLIEDVDSARSRRPTSERSRVGVWRGTRAAQAGRAT